MHVVECAQTIAAYLRDGDLALGRKLSGSPAGKLALTLLWQSVITNRDA